MKKALFISSVSHGILFVLAVSEEELLAAVDWLFGSAGKQRLKAINGTLSGAVDMLLEAVNRWQLSAVGEYLLSAVDGHLQVCLKCSIRVIYNFFCLLCCSVCLCCCF